MAGYPGKLDELNGGLDSLFAQMRQQNSNASPNVSASNFLPQMASQPSNPYFEPQLHGYHNPSVSSPLPTPPASNQPPHHGSAVISPINTPQPQNMAGGGQSNADRTTNLLNLLKFSSPSSSSQVIPVTVPHPSTRTPSIGSAATINRGNSDLLAALMGTSRTKENQGPASQLRSVSQQTTTNPEPATGPSADTQAYLLSLLNRPKPAQTDPEPAPQQVSAVTPPSGNSSQDEAASLTQTLRTASLAKNTEAQTQSEPAQAAPKGLFTYVNPFEQLAASSPRNRTPKPSTPAQSAPSFPAMQILKPPRHNVAESSESKRKSDDRSPANGATQSKGKAGANSIPPLQAAKQDHTPTDVEGDTANKETVAEALSEVGSRVDKQVEEALARASEEEKQSVIAKDLVDMTNSKTDAEFEAHAQATATGLKEILNQDGNGNILKDAYPAPVAKAIQDIVDETAQGNMPDRWDSEETPGNQEPSAIKVFQFPMKPWISITVTPKPQADIPEFNDEILLDVARLRKEFDQIDRNLAAASAEYIAYGMSKNGGIRIIRQIDGQDMRIFTETRDRVFNVALSNAHGDGTESFLATGISGTVYWGRVYGTDAEFDGSPRHKNGFALPPIPTIGEETSGGMLKTRARMSLSHPEFFAVGRGKSIQIVWPSVIQTQGCLKDGKERLVDTQKYLSIRSFKINTGKAGKDFTFSQDDTAIISLDKAGRVKFWDVSAIINIQDSEKIQPVEISEPMMTLTTTSENQKSWPTSVLMVDKIRPYVKGGALRYLIVGMKQNHTLQLWDLGLGKPVQEIHLPHEKESDAVCSVHYHPLSGIIVVGHPTRNSIFFIHLSAPRYNVPRDTTQADYIKRLAAKDATLPKPEATAVMSGIREYSFVNKGDLRSLDIIPNPSSSFHEAEPSLFELYTMHSKGVTSITVKPLALGWNKENRVIHAVQAVEDGTITVDVLKQPVGAVGSPANTAPAPKSTPKDSMAKELGRKSVANGELPPNSEPTLTSNLSKTSVKVDSPVISGSSSTEKPEKAEKRKKKKGSSAEQVLHTARDASAVIPTGSTSPNKISNGTLPTLDLQKTAAANTTSSSTIGLSQETVNKVIKNMEASLAAEVSRLLTGSLDTLYRRFDDDKRAQAATSSSNQEAVLRLVSSTLTENVQKSLESIVTGNIKSMGPAISEAASKAVTEQLGAKLKSTLPRELQNALPHAIANTMQKPELLKSFSDSMVKSVAFKVEEQFATVLQKSIAPTFTNLAVQAAQRATADVQRQAMEQIASFERKAQADSKKIDQLSILVTGLAETVSTMAAAQSKFQGEFLKFQQQAARENRHASQPSQTPSSGPSAQRMQAPISRPAQAQKSEIEKKMDEISALMDAGNIEEACMNWLQSGHESDIFDLYFSRIDPAAVVHVVQPLVLLSLGVVVTGELEGKTLIERLAWIEAILQLFATVQNSLVCASWLNFFLE
jgi:hypothetical protein